MKNRRSLLIIFTRNIVLGKCKTRLAKTVGAQAALDIYKFLVRHTVAISKALEVDKWVFYSEYPENDDLFDDEIYRKFTQTGLDLGQRMKNAFKTGFDAGYENIIIIGSDIYDLNSKDLKVAFNSLAEDDYVIGPAQDGGYYLLGMKSLDERIFLNKSWSTELVMDETLADLQKARVSLLNMRNDIDVYEDIKDLSVFERFLIKDKE